MKLTPLIFFLFLLASCKSPAEKWLDSMADYKAVHGKELTLEIRKVKPRQADTSAITYSVRLFPGKAWLEENGTKQMERLSYGMDSCFSLHTAAAAYGPDIVQPINNGVKGCYEYLVSFNVVKTMKYRPMELVYTDRFIDKKLYRLALNR
jgi:hypothetical protein